MGDRQHQGFLVKEGGNWKTWKKRYFVLKNEELCYSKTQTSDHLGVIQMEEIRLIIASEYKKKKHCFQVETPRRIYYFCASSDAERDEWMKILQDEADRVQEKGKYAKGGHSSSSTSASDSPAPASPAPAQGSNILAPNSPMPRKSTRLKASDMVSIQDFELLKVIGKGSFGKVFQVRKKDNGKIYALKVLQKKAIIERKELEHTRTEKNVLMRLVHPFLVNMYYYFQTEDRVCFVMDFINGGELFSHLQANRRLPENRVQFYSAEVVLGLEYLHACGVLYRDLKPENLLLNADGHIVLTDFGIAKEGLKGNNDRTATFCGTPEYLAPEVLRGEPYGKPIDWWSLGTLIYEMLHGSPPFYNTSVQAMYRAILERDPQYAEDISPEALAIMKACLIRDPAKRLCDPKQLKQHVFFRGIDWDKLISKEVTPPYIPPVKSQDDVSMISREFLDLSVEFERDDSRLSVSIQKEFADFGS